jgi:dual specificity tyrosine-phosphorylation-regulated kinase 2/3/4
VKPENILLTNEQKTGIKLVDFGSACFSEEKKFTYFQSRFYRAPEVIFGHKYDCSIDMWSLGLVLVELYLGYPLCSGQNESEQISNYIAQFGYPPLDFLDNSTRTSKYFDSNMKPIFKYDRKSQSFLLNASIDQSFRDFIETCCQWDP